MKEGKSWIMAVHWSGVRCGSVSGNGAWQIECRRTAVGAMAKI